MMREMRYRGYTRTRSPSPQRTVRDYSPCWSHYLDDHCQPWDYSPRWGRYLDDHRKARDFLPSRRYQLEDVHSKRLYSPHSSPGRISDSHRADYSWKELERSTTRERVDHYSSHTSRSYDHEEKGRKDGYEGNMPRFYEKFGSSASMPCQPDDHFDESRRSEVYGLKNPSYDHGLGDSTIVTSMATNGDYYRGSRYLDASRPEILSGSQNLDNTKMYLLETDKRDSDIYTPCDSHGKTSRGGLDVDRGSILSSSQYTGIDLHTSCGCPFLDNSSLDRKCDNFYFHYDRYLDIRYGNIHFQGKLHQDEFSVDSPVDCNIYKCKEECPPSSRNYLKDDFDHMASVSHQQVSCEKADVVVSSGIIREDIPYVFSTENLYRTSDQLQLSPLMDTASAKHDICCTKLQESLPLDIGVQLDGIRTYSRSYLEPAKRKHGGHVHFEFGRSKMDYNGRRSTELPCQNTIGIEDNYRRKYLEDLSRTDAVDSIIGGVGNSCRQDLLRDRLFCDQHACGVQLATDCSREHRSLNVRSQGADELGHISTHLDYGREAYLNCNSSKLGELYNYDIDDGPLALEEQTSASTSNRYDLYMDEVGSSSRRRLSIEGLSSARLSDRMLKHVRVENLKNHAVGTKISNGGKIAYKIDEYAGDDMDPRSSLKKFKLNTSKYKKISKVASFRSSFVKYKDSGRRGIKKRLGRPQKLHVSQRLVRKYKPKLKERLGPACMRKHPKFPCLKNLSSTKSARVLDELGGDSNHQAVGEHSENSNPSVKTEPPEKSDDFKQLVHIAFLKFLKLVNETSKRRKKYMEQGKAGNLRCIVCGSGSDEFTDTDSLAMHAFSSTKVGLRSQHLGFHKALCVLMGWKNAENHSCQWVCEIMTDSEIAALKEDFIIWPPVGIICNSSLDSTDPDDRVIVSTEDLKARFEDMGFGNIKVCHGKPANESVMLVKFIGTLSGLQDAEKFHDHYINTKHGRADFLQLKSRINGSSSQRSQVVSTDEKENILYGYLGIAEDLDKLDFEAKKHSVIRSKKEIMNIVEAAVRFPDRNYPMF